MNARTKLSAKGQVVIPKDVRMRLRLKAGDIFEVIETTNGVTLKRADDRPRISMEEFNRRLAPIRALYKGSPATIEEMDEAVARLMKERAKRNHR